MKKRRLLLPAALLTAAAAMTVIYTNTASTSPRGTGSIYPTAWSWSTAQSDGPGSFYFHVPGWNYDTGEWTTTIWHTTLAIPSDLNGDGIINTADLGILIEQFGTAGPDADINGDGVVDSADLGLLIAAFTSPADLNRDGSVNQSDYELFFSLIDDTGGPDVNGDGTFGPEDLQIMLDSGMEITEL